jgi:hypothetical protein
MSYWEGIISQECRWLENIANSDLMQLYLLQQKPQDTTKCLTLVAVALAAQFLFFIFFIFVF